MLPLSSFGRLAALGARRSARWPLVLVAIAAGACGAATPAPGPAPRAVAPPEVDAPAACAAGSLDHLVVELRDYYCSTAEGSIAASDIESCDEIEITLDEPTGERRGLDARLLQLATPSGRVFVLLACAGGRAEGFLLEDLWSFTDEEETTRSEGVVGRFALVDLVPGGASELRLDVAFSRSREEWHGCTLESSTRPRRSWVTTRSTSSSRCGRSSPSC